MGIIQRRTNVPLGFTGQKGGIAKNVLLTVHTVMHQEQVDMMAGDFNVAAWRRRSGNQQRHDSTIEEALARRMGRRRWIHQATEYRQ